LFSYGHGESWAEAGKVGAGDRFGCMTQCAADFYLAAARRICQLIEDISS